MCEQMNSYIYKNSVGFLNILSKGASNLGKHVVKL